MTIIDWMNQVLVHKKPWDSFSESDKKTFSPFILNRFLSMDIEFIEIVNMFQKYSVGMLENKDIYEFYRRLLPKGKRFNKYIKGKKSKKYDPELISLLCNHYKEGKNNIIDYIDLIEKEELKEILEMYGTNEKTIKRLLK
tara:strand:+ start:12 stop:431 length:420 start_codon:yes stop_codon:yes gene_type:complete